MKATTAEHVLRANNCNNNKMLFIFKAISSEAARQPACYFERGRPTTNSIVNSFCSLHGWQQWVLTGAEI